MRDKKFHWFLLLSLLIFFVLSFIGHKGNNDWYLNAAPVYIPLLALIFTYPRFRFTSLVYLLCWIFGIILLYGAHYNYNDPLFDWLKQVFPLARNDFDRLAHFGQGFVPAIVAREILLRKTPLRPGKTLFFLVLSICLAIGALYEIIEMLGAWFYRESASTFLGTQGDSWDTQRDMFSCLLGAIVAQLVLARAHDRALIRLREAEMTIKSPKPSRSTKAKIISA